jgi:2-deoxy-D-gluconate 3-dehydrogenase
VGFVRVPQLSLEGKTALITGAGGGLGLAVSQLFGRAGAGLFLSARSEEQLRINVQEFARWGVQASCLGLDLAAPNAGQELVEYAQQSMDGVDILVHCLESGQPRPAAEASPEEWEAVLEANLRAARQLSQALGRHLAERGWGRIIHVSWHDGLMALLQRTQSCPSQGGLRQLTRELALEWAPHNVTVNAVAPVLVETPLLDESLADPAFEPYVRDSVPLGGLASAAEVAWAALYLASEEADMITGQVLRLDGGWAMKQPAPGSP